MENKHILVVDDDDAILRLVSIVLKRASFEVSTAEDAIKATEILPSVSPDLIILDIMMPGMSGIEFLRQLRSGNSHNDIPVVMLSALSTQAQIDEAINAGANQYLTKTQIGSHLVGAVQEILQ